jgi:hypothetical protein
MRCYQSKTEWADTDVDIDPERPRLSRNIVEEKPKGAEEDDQPAGRPMKSYSAGAVTRGAGAILCFTASLIGKRTYVARSQWGCPSLRNVFLRAVVCSGQDRKEDVRFTPGHFFPAHPSCNSSSEGPHHPSKSGRLRFTLSYRDVEDLLAQRGLDVSYETVRRWVLKFRPLLSPENFAANARGQRRDGISMRWP